MISQQPLGTAEKLGDSVNISLHTFKALCNEVRSLKDSMEMYNNRMSAIENKMTCVLDKCVEIFDKISYVENSLEKRPSEAGSRNVLFNSKLATKSQSLSGQMTDTDEDLWRTQPPMRGCSLRVRRSLDSTMRRTIHPVLGSETLPFTRPG